MDMALDEIDELGVCKVPELDTLQMTATLYAPI